MYAKNAEDAFVTRGFRNRKLATTGFRQHELSASHKDAVERAITLPATTADICKALSTAHAREQLENIQCLLKILSTLRFLTKQSCAIRGDDNE